MRTDRGVRTYDSKPTVRSTDDFSLKHGPADHAQPRTWLGAVVRGEVFAARSINSIVSRRRGDRVRQSSTG